MAQSAISSGQRTTMFALAAICAGVSAYVYYGISNVKATSDVGILAGIAVVTALALNDAYNHRAKTALKSIAARAAKSGVSAPAAAQEAVGWATMTSNIAYVAAFASLALYVVPNIASLLQTPFGLFAPAVSMLLPAAALAAYGRNLI